MLTFRKYLNPNFALLDSVVSFSDVDLEALDQLYGEEYPYLIDLIKLVHKDVVTGYERLKQLEKQIEDQIRIIDQETGDDKSAAVSTYNKLLTEAEIQVENINRHLSILDAPYFGKIIFDRKRNSRFPKAKIPVYIGRFAYFDRENHRNLITDWRAPIANLYYKNQGPTDDVMFVSPVGEQQGDLSQKRQFEIATGRIHHIYDAKTGNTSADEFLLSQLNKRMGKKLADIVATIQDQQNEIIREGINAPSVIQGVAGSGKTTILLHKLAYLLYTYEKEIQPEHTLIIAPNTMFLDYISDVLPSLGVVGTQQNTFMFWAKGVLGWNDQFVLSNEPDNLKVKEFKGSLQFKEIVEKFFEQYEKELFENAPDKLKDIIAKRYYELKDKSAEISIDERITLSIEFAFAQQNFHKNFVGGYINDLQNIKERTTKLRDYFKMRVNVYQVYRKLFESDIWSEFPDLDPAFVKEVKKHSLKTLKPINKVKLYKFEDLSPLIYLHLKLYGKKEHMKHYVMVDEAQDISIFQIYVLNMIAKNGNLTLAGDLAQSIIPPFHIKDWNDVIKLLHDESPEREVRFHQLSRCYRATVEVIDFANKTLSGYFPDSYKLPEAVLRHGDPVKEIVFSNKIAESSQTEHEELIKILKAEFTKGSATCALVCRTEEDASKIHEVLKPFEKQLGRNIINYDEDNYHDGLLILPVSRAKGLEFDTVLVADLSADNYTENDLDVRLLYVAFTRALHRLFIITNKNKTKSPIIKNEIVQAELTATS